jgi:predicted transcriptional regulator of viral defense system
LVERETCVFSFDETKGILQTSNQSVRHILMDLTRKGRLQRIQRGKYLLVPEKAGRKLYWAESPLVIVAHLIDVYYVGFWTAMSYWGMTDPLHGFCGNNKKEKQFGVWESKI